MPTSPPISAPAGYAPASAVGFSDEQNRLAVVSSAKPLPVSIARAPSGQPIVGSATGAALAGPFVAESGLPITVLLEGSWTGTVKVLRSRDGGVTRHALLAGGMPWGEFTQPGCEQVWVEQESGVSFYLDIQLDTGTLAYRVSQ